MDEVNKRKGEHEGLRDERSSYERTPEPKATGVKGHQYVLV
jgi:hypothetical protein